MRPHRQGFTLVELVVVIMILGILAGVAAPKFFNTSKTAGESSLKQTLAVIRDAIELYAAQNGGALPAAVDGDFQSDLAPYLRGTFPKSPVGTANTIKFTAGVDGTTGWIYAAGNFTANSSATDDAGTAYSAY